MVSDNSCTALQVLEEYTPGVLSNIEEHSATIYGQVLEVIGGFGTLESLAIFNQIVALHFFDYLSLQVWAGGYGNSFSRDMVLRLFKTGIQNTQDISNDKVFAEFYRLFKHQNYSLGEMYAIVEMCCEEYFDAYFDEICIDIENAAGL